MESWNKGDPERIVIYNNTMERLRRINHGKRPQDKEAIVMLSEELKAARAKIQRLMYRGYEGKRGDVVFVDEWQAGEMEE